MFEIDDHDNDDDDDDGRLSMGILKAHFVSLTAQYSYKISPCTQ